MTNNHMPAIRHVEENRPNVLINHRPDLTYRYFSYEVGGEGRMRFRSFSIRRGSWKAAAKSDS
jgi:hypothetical protein